MLGKWGTSAGRFETYLLCYFSVLEVCRGPLVGSLKTFQAYSFKRPEG